ncbi:unnamed protein product, partial [marine sediment metagenome]
MSFDLNNLPLLNWNNNSRHQIAIKDNRIKIFSSNRIPIDKFKTKTMNQGLLQL